MLTDCTLDSISTNLLLMSKPTDCLLGAAESPRDDSQGAQPAEQDEGQAEDLVSDVHAKAQQASQEAVLAGQAQQEWVSTAIASHS